MSCYSLPGITKIEVIRCECLPPQLMNKSICGFALALYRPVEKVEFIGRPTLKWEGTIVSGTRQEKSTLEFSTRSQLPEGVNLAFVVTGADGTQRLIGTREGRYPVISYSESTGEPGGSAALRSYKITHIALKSVLPCIL